jgi:hypothetical protein
MLTWAASVVYVARLARWGIYWCDGGYVGNVWEFGRWGKGKTEALDSSS